MTSFTLKLIGIISMLADHIGKAFFPEQQWLTLIGRLAFPIFAFGIAEGYLHTHDINKYFKRLAIFALISQIPYMLFNAIISANYWQSTNVIFTLLLGLAAIFFFDRSSNKAIGFLITLALCIIAELVHTDYGAYGVSVVLLFYFLSQTMHEKTLQHKKVRILDIFLAFSGLTLLRYLHPLLITGLSTHYIQTILCTILSFVPILLYNGKLGIKCKYLFYVFYPVHQILIASLCYFIH